MLVLSRKVGQSIIIGDNIELMVIEVSGEQVRIGIDAPRSIRINRKELLSGGQSPKPSLPRPLISPTDDRVLQTTERR